MITTIKFAKLNKNAKLPTKRIEDAGWDLYLAPEENETRIAILPGKTVLLNTGICSAFDTDYVCVIKDRSSLGSQAIITNAGVIDAQYRGEWKVAMTNLTDRTIIFTDETDLNFERAIVYPLSKAIAQFLVLPVPYVEIEEYTPDEIKAIPSVRGEGGFGSTDEVVNMSTK